MTNVTLAEVVAEATLWYTEGVSTTPTKPTIPTPAPGTCGCGCGETVAKRFRPGHDARLKSNLLDVARNGATRQAERAAWLMVEAGWSRFVDDAILLALPQRNRKGQRKLHVDDVEVWIGEPVSQPGQCHGRQHSNAACPALTKSAKACGATNPITKLASAAWTTRRSTSPERVAHLVGSWDLCEECCTTDTVLEQCERLWMRVALGVAALDQEAGNVEVLTAAAIAMRRIGVVVEPDLDPTGQAYPMRAA